MTPQEKQELLDALDSLQKAAKAAIGGTGSFVPPSMPHRVSAVQAVHFDPELQAARKAVEDEVIAANAAQQFIALANKVIDLATSVLPGGGLVAGAVGNVVGGGSSAGSSQCPFKNILSTALAGLLRK